MLAGRTLEDIPVVLRREIDSKPGDFE